MPTDLLWHNDHWFPALMSQRRDSLPWLYIFHFLFAYFFFHYASVCLSSVVPLIIKFLQRAPAACPFSPVACQSTPMHPPRSRNTKSVIPVHSFVSYRLFNHLLPQFQHRFSYWLPLLTSCLMLVSRNSSRSLFSATSSVCGLKLDKCRLSLHYPVAVD